MKIVSINGETCTIVANDDMLTAMKAGIAEYNSKLKGE